ncbi:hypothetical protein F8M41_023565 [Gigaspora margarita]|uniref:Uncharacterized protein n=1 Tax=Gigaspora margarita TaxID=4874 RepID=A0A8H4B0R8_GIGMA|nr:hypothetical protein F8M41_023565 [Gigaspora margarita]
MKYLPKTSNYDGSTDEITPEEREVTGGEESAKETGMEGKNDKEFLELLKNDKKRPKTFSNDGSNNEIKEKRQ